MWGVTNLFNMAFTISWCSNSNPIQCILLAGRLSCEHEISPCVWGIPLPLLLQSSEYSMLHPYRGPKNSLYSGRSETSWECSSGFQFQIRKSLERNCWLITCLEPASTRHSIQVCVHSKLGKCHNTCRGFRMGTMNRLEESNHNPVVPMNLCRHETTLGLKPLWLHLDDQELL